MNIELVLISAQIFEAVVYNNFPSYLIDKVLTLQAKYYFKKLLFSFF